MNRIAMSVGVVMLATGLSAPAVAQDISGELVILDYFGGSQRDAMEAIEKGFMAKYPSVTIKDLSVASTGDPTGTLRTIIMGGQPVDLLISSWPGFRTEMIDNGLARPLDDAWAKYDWSKNLSPAWKELGSVDGKFYSLTFTYGDRTSIFYRPDVLKKAGIETPPATWEEFLASFKKLKAAGVTAVEVPGKTWAHQEVFEELIGRVGGAEGIGKLARHEIPWTDPMVKQAFDKYVEMLNAGCCVDPSVMMATEWDQGTDNVLKNGTSAYLPLGAIANTRAVNEDGLTEGVDFSVFNFPALGLGHDHTVQVDSDEMMSLSSGQNPAAADAFLDYLLSAEAANIIAKSGTASPSLHVDKNLYGPVIAKMAEKLDSPEAEVVPVIGNQLPVALGGDEYHLQLQRLLQTPNEDTIHSVMDALEAKAQEVY